MKRFILPLLLITSITVAIAEKNEEEKKTAQTVSFKVTGYDNESIAGAEVSIPALNMVSYTDMDGNFSTEVPADFDGDIKISFISHMDKTLKISDLSEDKIQLNEE